MSVSESYEGLKAAMTGLSDAIAPDQMVSLELPPEITALETEMQVLLGALASIENSVQNTLRPLERLQEALEDPNIITELEARLQAEIETSQEAITEAGQGFASLCEEMAQTISDQLKDWLVDAVDSLGDEMSGAVNDVQQAAADGVEELCGSVETAITNLAEDIKNRIEDRANGAVQDVIEAAVERALAEVIETIITTETGAMITSAIGPYLPVVIAIKPALPAIQDALDLMRGGV